MKKPKLLLHTCCAPCFSSVYEQIENDYEVTIHWYNPNIFPYEEYSKRLNEILRYSQIVGVRVMIDDDYFFSSRNWEISMNSYRKLPEGGLRCQTCIRHRLLKTAKHALESGFDLFGTTLTVSPQKDADAINKIGLELSGKFEVRYLETNFKKRNGHLRSVELSKKYKLYRQSYCGCEKSMETSRA